MDIYDRIEKRIGKLKIAALQLNARINLHEDLSAIFSLNKDYTEEINLMKENRKIINAKIKR